MKTISKFLLFGSSVVVATAAFVAINAQSVENLQGKMLPAFTMTDLNGKKITSQSLRGKVVLIDLWATWCGPCQKASPVMQSLHNKYGERGLVVIGANTWENNDKTGANAKKYRDQHKYTYLFTYNNDDLAKAWNVEGIPTMILLDKQGKVSKVFVGFDPSLEKQLSAAIEPLLK